MKDSSSIYRLSNERLRRALCARNPAFGNAAAFGYGRAEIRGSCVTNMAVGERPARHATRSVVGFSYTNDAGISSFVQAVSVSARTTASRIPPMQMAETFLNQLNA